MPDRKQKIVLGVAILLYLLVLGSVSILRHYQFQTQTWDMGVFVQTFWNTLEGRVMQNHLEEVANHLGVHMSPLLFLLVPGYALFPSPYFLLVIQTLALASGAIPLYRFSRRRLGDPRLACLLALGYLGYPSLAWVNLFDFHEIAFFIPLLLAAVDFLDGKRMGWGLFFLALAASTKEDAILMVLAFGLYFALSRQHSLPERKIGIGIAAASLVYFFLAIQVIMPALGGGLLRLDRYAALGSSGGEILRTVVTEPGRVAGILFTAPKLTYLLWLFLPVLFLPLASPVAFLFLLGPGLLENLLTTLARQSQGLYQYDAVLIAGVFIASVQGLRALLRRWPARARKLSWALGIALTIGFLAQSPVSPFSFPVALLRPNPHWESLRTLVRMVPPGVSVAAPTNLVPHLSHREHAHPLGQEPFPVDVVLVDGADPFGFVTPEAFQAYVERYAASPDYTVYSLDERYAALFRTGVAPQVLLPQPE